MLFQGWEWKGTLSPLLIFVRNKFIAQNTFFIDQNRSILHVTKIKKEEKNKYFNNYWPLLS